MGAKFSVFVCAILFQRNKKKMLACRVLHQNITKDAKHLTFGVQQQKDSTDGNFVVLVTQCVASLPERPR